MRTFELSIFKNFFKLNENNRIKNVLSLPNISKTGYFSKSNPLLNEDF